MQGLEVIMTDPDIDRRERTSSKVATKHETGSRKYKKIYHKLMSNLRSAVEFVIVFSTCKGIRNQLNPLLSNEH